jgi:hypothetical protein
MVASGQRRPAGPPRAARPLSAPMVRTTRAILLSGGITISPLLTGLCEHMARTPSVLIATHVAFAPRSGAQALCTGLPTRQIAATCPISKRALNW